MKQIFLSSYSLLIAIIININRGILPVYGHVGRPCHNFLIRYYCTGSYTTCDTSRTPYICRCKSNYPVLIDPHKCSQSKKYGQRCEVSVECSYHDKNSYCHQLSHRKECECLVDFIYDAALARCVKKEFDNSNRSRMVLPTAVGVSLALSSLLCCFLAVLHFCRRKRQRQEGNRSVSTRWSSLLQSNSDTRQQLPAQNAATSSNTFSANDPLPPYEVAISLQPVMKSNISDPQDEPPPCYEEVMKHSELNDDKPKAC